MSTPSLSSTPMSTSAATPAAVSRSRLILQALFSPFVRVAGGTALGLGVGMILLTGGLGHLSGIHFDGVLDAHAGRGVPLWVSLAEGVVNWLTLGVVFLIAGRVISRSAFRSIDLLGTQALARWPMVFISLVCFAPGFQRFTRLLVEALPVLTATPEKFVLPEGAMGDALVFGGITLVMLLCNVWMIALMWKSFSLCCHVRTGKAVVAFIIGLFIAEMASKVLIGLLYRVAL